MADKQAPKKGFNIRLFLITLVIAVGVVGPIIFWSSKSQPDISVSKHKITREELEDFKVQLAQMVSQYTVRHEGEMAIVHPPENSDIYLLGKNYDWGKFILELEKGKNYRLNLTSQEMKHAIVVYELKLMHRMKPGEFKTVQFSPIKAGRFKLICGDFCGPGHARMIGEIIVVDPDEPVKQP